MKQSKSVLQFTNLYLAFTEATETEDKETLNMIKALISEYQPDLCIFTGNQIYANDKEKGLAHYQLFLEFMNQFDIKIATTFGNRDAVDGDMKSELRQMEAEISQNYVKRAYRKVVNHKEAYVIEVKKQGKLLHQLYMIDNGTDGVIEQAHITWLQDVQNKTLDQYGYVPKHNLLFTHHPIIEQELNQANKAIKTLVTDHYIGLITFYGLVSIIAVNFSNAIMKKKCDENVRKAEKLYRSVIEQLYQHQTINYQDLCKISYYGGNEYDILLISNPKLYKIIQQNESQKRKQLKNHHIKI